MQSETRYLIVLGVCTSIGVVLALARGRFRTALRVLAVGAVTPISILAVYALLISVSFAGSSNFSWPVFLLLLAGVAGVAALWIALLFPSVLRNRRSRLTRVVLMGLLIGCAVAAWLLDIARRRAFDHPVTYLVAPALLIGVWCVYHFVRTKWAARRNGASDRS
jgi:uncharacterized membrane protein